MRCVVLWDGSGLAILCSVLSASMPTASALPESDLLRPARGAAVSAMVRAKGWDHPRLHMRREDRERLRSEVEGTRRRYWENLLAWVRRHRGWEPPRDRPEGRLNEVALETCGAFLTNASLAASLSGRPGLIRLAKRWALAMASERPEKARNYGYGAYVAGLARAYDWLYEEFDAGERERLRDRIARIAGLLHDASHPGRRGSAWWAGCHLHHDFWIPTGGYGEAALALVGEVGEAGAWAARARDEFEEVFRWLGEDGAWHEGPADWCYAMAPLLWFYGAWRSATGEDLHDRPWLRKTALYRLYHRLPDGRAIALDDSFQSGRYNTSGSAACHLLRRLASLFRDGRAQWLADREESFDLKEGPKGVPQAPYEGSSRARSWPEYPHTPSHCAAWNVLWYDPGVPARSPEGLPPSRHFENLGIAILRSSWAEDAMVASLACGPMAGHAAAERIASRGRARIAAFYHDHVDFNDFTLFARGEYVVIPPGYARRDSAYHNVVAINGCHMRADPGLRPRIVAFGTCGGLDYAVGDAGCAFPAAAGVSRFRRHAILVRPDRFILCDDIRLSKGVRVGGAWRRFEWFVHSDPETHAVRLRGKTAEWKSAARDRRLSMDCILPESFAWEKGTLESVEGEGLLETVKLVVSEWYGRAMTVLTAWYAGESGGGRPVECLPAEGLIAVRVESGTRTYVIAFCRKPTSAESGASLSYVLARPHGLLLFGLATQERYGVSRDGEGRIVVRRDGRLAPRRGGVVWVELP